MTIAETVAEAIRQPICASDGDIAISVSIGVTLARPAETVDELMARADIAMYQAKQGGRSRVTRLD